MSSLYYQAFEEAYNQLIWSDYAEYLNSLVIDGKPFTELLGNNRYNDLSSLNELGYLPRSSKSRQYYVNYISRNHGEVKNTCMYGSFSIMIENVVPSSRLTHFSDFLAAKAGFASKDEMYSNSEYLNKLQYFSESLVKSVEFRNNASHGGALVTKDQCAVDKETVLSDIQYIRVENIGLIQQLLSLFH